MGQQNDKCLYREGISGHRHAPRAARGGHGARMAVQCQRDSPPGGPALQPPDLRRPAARTGGLCGQKGVWQGGAGALWLPCLSLGGGMAPRTCGHQANCTSPGHGCSYKRLGNDFVKWDMGRLLCPQSRVMLAARKA